MLASLVIIFCIASVHCDPEANSSIPELPLRGCKKEKELVESCNDVEECGVYTMMIEDVEREVYCKVMGSKKFIVAQRRDDFGEPSYSFFRGWDEYKFGFGNPRKSFWLGNKALHNLTETPKEVHIVLTDFEGGKVTIVAYGVQISDEISDYMLSLSSVSPMPMGESFSVHNGKRFSTKDRDNSGHDCANTLMGAWWYETTCIGYSNLNGLYLEGHHETYGVGVNYFHFRGDYYSLKSTEILIRVDDEE